MIIIFFIYLLYFDNFENSFSINTDVKLREKKKKQKSSLKTRFIFYFLIHLLINILIFLNLSFVQIKLFFDFKMI
jgi:hypothetical protein